MSDLDKHDEQPQHIEAFDFDVPGAPSQENDALQARDANYNATSVVKRPWWHSQFNLMLCVFALLAASAGLFVALAPTPVATPIAATPDAGDTENSNSSNPSVEAETPFDEGRRAQARTESQEILSDLLAAKKDLEAKNVTDWAAEQYQVGLDLAQAGDDLYSKQEYAPAIESYKQALTSLDALSELIPDVLQGLIRDGIEAIDAGKTALAKETLGKALALDANSIEALDAMGRANNLDQVLDLLRLADLDEQSFQTSDALDELQSAQSNYQAALQLDDKTAAARTGVARVADLIADKRFRAQMSAGFKALFVNRYGSAKAAFSKALNIKPNDTTAKAAYQQSLASDSRSSLSGLLSAAQGFEKNEQWASALGNYQAVLQRDPNQVSAKLGKIRSQARSGLDTRLTTIMQDSLALGRKSQREKASAILADAQAIRKKGPKLAGQISQLENALKYADVPLNVSFSSDDLTNVSLTKAGTRALDLGRFAQKKLKLKPGRYVLSGTRLGFRDVRKEIELVPNQKGVLSFSILCDEQVGA